MPSNKRYSLKNLKLDEISLVDRPANQEARVVIWKRNSDKEMYGDMTDAEKTRMRELMDEKGMSEKDARAQCLREMRKDAGEPGDNPSSKENGMTVEELEKKLGDLETQISQLTKERDDAKSAANALEKAVAEAGLSVEKSDDGVKVEKAADPEFVEFNGEKIEKSAVPASVLKAIEEGNAKIAKMEKDRQAENLRKRADEEIPDLAGTPDERGALLKAVDSIEDEAVRKSVSEALKAANAAVSKQFESVGKAASEDEASATYRLNKMAEDYAAKHNVDFAVAHSEVTKTAEGKALVIESRKEQN